MNLFSMEDLRPAEVRRILAGEPAPHRGDRRLLAILDFLPLGVEGLALRAAAVRAGAQVVTGALLFPGFPEATDPLEAAGVVGAYADAVVLRHPLRGTARAAAALSGAPVLSAGDGTGEDPLFALADLAALSDRLGGLEKKSVALCGDLLRNRRAHSLAGGLVASGARVLLVPARGAEPSEGLLDRLARRRGSHPVRFGARSMSSLLDMVDSWLLTPDLDHQLSLFSDVVATSERERRMVRHQVAKVDAIWVAAPRDENGEPAPDPVPPQLPWRPPDGRDYVTPSPSDEDRADPASRAGGEVRALTAVLSTAFAQGGSPPRLPRDVYGAEEGLRCTNPACIACREPRRVAPAFVLLRLDPVTLGCVYCEARRKAKYVGSRVERKFHVVTSSQVRKILPRNTVFFATKREAEAAGFVASKI